MFRTLLKVIETRASGNLQVMKSPLLLVVFLPLLFHCLIYIWSLWTLPSVTSVIFLGSCWPFALLTGFSSFFSGRLFSVRRYLVLVQKSCVCLDGHACAVCGGRTENCSTHWRFGWWLLYPTDTSPCELAQPTHPNQKMDFCCSLLSFCSLQKRLYSF